mgnify:CR=1 FL=1
MFGQQAEANAVLSETHERGQVMPRVGKKHYDYTPKGRAAAQKAAKRTGMPIRDQRKKK